MLLGELEVEDEQFLEVQDAGCELLSELAGDLVAKAVIEGVGILEEGDIELLEVLVVLKSFAELVDALVLHARAWE